MNEREQQPASPPQTPPAATAELEEVGTLTRVSDGRVYVLGYGTFRVGRQRRANIVLKEKTVSRHHADVIYESGRYVLYDHSTNGTWVNRAIVAVAQPLRTGDVVKFGEIEFRFGMQAVPKSEAAGASETAPKRVSKSSTIIMKGGKKKGGRIRQRFNRVAPWVLLVLIAAALVIYFFFPDTAAQIISKLPPSIQELLGRPQ